MKRILACRAPLVGRLHVCRDDRIANSTFALSLQRALDIPAECKQAIDKVAVGKHNNPLDR